MFLYYITLFFFLTFHLFGYDTSFSDIFEDLYKKYHVYDGDWCDQIRRQIKDITDQKGRSVSSAELSEAGIDPDYLDAMAVAYCEKYPDTYISIVWPTVSYSHEDMLYEEISKHSTIVYRKKFTLKNHGPLTLLSSIPEKRPHLAFDSHCYFSKQLTEYPMMCFVVRTSDPQNNVRAKHKIRDILQLYPYCIHFCDTHDQCLDLAYMLLNNNSIRFLNDHQYQAFQNFNQLFELYKGFLKTRGINSHDVCVDGSCVLSAYGIRDCAVDFDFLCIRHGPFGNIHPLDHHNIAWSQLGLSVGDIIYNPKNFFYYKNLKFTSLSCIRNFKILQARPNDRRDVELIDALIGR